MPRKLPASELAREANKIKNAVRHPSKIPARSIKNIKSISRSISTMTTENQNLRRYIDSHRGKQ